MSKNLKLVNALIILASVLLLLYTGYRAYTIAFTADEAGSYLLFKESSIRIINKVSEGTHIYLTLDLDRIAYIRDANNHFINTLLMMLCSFLFGDSELSLRSPNLLAHLFYLIYSYRLLRLQDSRMVLFAGFILLNFNSLLLDYFSLARGYGISVACIMVSLYHMMAVARKESGSMRQTYLFAMLATYANFTAFNYYVALIMTDILLAMYNEPVISKVTLRDMIRRNKSKIVSNAIFITITMSILLLESAMKQYYFGTQKIASSVYSVVWSSLYELKKLAGVASVLSIVAGIIVIVALAVTMRQIFRSKKIAYTQIPFIVFVFCAALCLIQHWILKLPLPSGRTGLYLIVLFTCSLVMFGARAGSAMNRHYPVILQGVAVIAMLACAYCMNLRYFMYSPYDSDSRMVYELIKRDSKMQRNVQVNAYWTLTGAMYYYQAREKNHNIHIATIWDKILLSQDTSACYYYFYDANPTPEVKTGVILARFRDPERYLMKKEGCK